MSSGWLAMRADSSIDLGLEALVDDALMRCVHVHQHQALGAFGQDVDADHAAAPGRDQGPGVGCVGRGFDRSWRGHGGSRRGCAGAVHRQWDRGRRLRRRRAPCACRSETLWPMRSSNLIAVCACQLGPDRRILFKNHLGIIPPRRMSAGAANAWRAGRPRRSHGVARPGAPRGCRESALLFCWVHVHVHPLRVDLHVQRNTGCFWPCSRSS